MVYSKELKHDVTTTAMAQAPENFGTIPSLNMIGSIFLRPKEV